MKLNLVDELFRRSDPGAPAIITAAGGTVTYSQLDAWTADGARALAATARQRVGLHIPNGLDHILWSLSLLRAGAVLVPVAPELTATERAELAATTALHAVLTRPGQGWSGPVLSTSSVIAGELPADCHLLPAPEKPPAFADADLLALNPALVRFSSGTTGRRKGIVLSHETLLARVTACNSGLQIGPGDRVIWMLPMAHHFAVSIMLYLLHGAATVVLESHLGADVLDGLRRHEGTVIYAAPFHYALLAAVPEAAPVPSLRLAVSTTAALPESTALAFGKTFQLPLRQALGIIECGLPLLNTRWPDKRASVGAAQQGFSAEIRDTQGAALQPGEIGELFLRGPGLVDAYLSPWTPQEEILQDGWFRTGDQARQDPDGAIFLEGRTHSVINVGGMKCFPEEIEACLADHPAVREARVMGIPHAQFGSVPAAEIVPVHPEAPPRLTELMSHCRQRLSGYKVPLKWVFVAALPRTPSGKIDRVAPLQNPAPPAE